MLTKQQLISADQSYLDSLRTRSLADWDQHLPCHIAAGFGCSWHPVTSIALVFTVAERGGSVASSASQAGFNLQNLMTSPRRKLLSALSSQRKLTTLALEDRDELLAAVPKLTSQDLISAHTAMKLITLLRMD